MSGALDDVGQAASGATLAQAVIGEVRSKRRDPDIAWLRYAEISGRHGRHSPACRAFVAELARVAADQAPAPITPAGRGEHAPIADAVESHILGQRHAEASLHLVATGIAVPDQLHTAWLQAQRNWGDDGARGFARSVQKTLERA